MMRENAFSKDMIELAKDDAEKGSMTKPMISTKKSRRNILLSRRIPVREWKDSIASWRTRPVDHGSESGLKDATFLESQDQGPRTGVIDHYCAEVPGRWEGPPDVEKAPQVRFQKCPTGPGA